MLFSSLHGFKIELGPLKFLQGVAGGIHFQNDRSKEGEYILTSAFPRQTKIRKVALEHLALPVHYDLSKSTPASDLDQAHIFYTRNSIL
jgi:hypothetical protein